MSQFTIEDLTRVMREAAGEDDGVSLDGDIATIPFDDLGYDSLALLETASQIEREYGVPLPDGVLADVHTPADFVRLVNERRETVAA
jgi:act minimal PKS acyl carrier protein